MQKTLTCIMCPIGCQLNVEEINGELKISGNSCKRGETYAKQEIKSPQRIVTALFPLTGGGVVSCKTSSTVPKDKIFVILKTIQSKEVSKPIIIGQVLIENILDLGVDIVATSAC